MILDEWIKEIKETKWFTKVVVEEWSKQTKEDRHEDGNREVE